MPVKAHLANGARHAARHAARRRYYYVASNMPSPAHQFFDAGFTPTSSPRMVNTAQVTLQQGPSSGNGGVNGPSAQQSKSSSSQPPTSTLVLPLPMGGATAPGSGASGRASGSSAHNGAAGGLLIPAPGNFSPPSFFPSILGSSEKAHSRSTFRLESGAYGIPKSRPATTQKKQESSAASSSPPSTPTTSTPGASSSTTPPPPRESLDLSCQIGDDAYFVRPNALGVADGVGGWSGRPGGNSALFSRRLMHQCSQELELLYPATTPPTASHTTPLLTPAAVLAPLPASMTDVDPVDILQRAYERTLELCRSDGLLGSSTALVALLVSPSPSSSHSSSQPRLRIAHIGDCLIGLIRQDELVYRSSEQQHRFNYPYQLGPQSQTTPQKDAFRIDLPVQEGDVIVLATDGLGDNLWDEDVLEEALRWGQDVRGMSEALAKRAKKVSESGASGGETPFSRRAHEENKTHVGGKVDDISVLVAVIEGCPAPEVAPAAYTPSSMPGPFFGRF